MHKFNYIFHQTDDANTLLRERYVEDPNKVTEQVLVSFCNRCNRWVYREDYLNHCMAGYCEMSREVSLTKEPETAL